MQPELKKFDLFSTMLSVSRISGFCLLLATLLFPAWLQAQTMSEVYEFSGMGGSGDYAAFWHTSNRQGVGSIDTESYYTRLGLSGDHFFSNRKLNVEWGADIVIGTNLTSTVFVQQAFVDLGWKKINLSVGQKERWGVFQNPRLSTGGLVESGNARPIPQIRFELPQYWVLPGTGEWLALKGHLAYGWFTDGEWQKGFVAEGKAHTDGVLYHSKSGFMRFGNEDKFPLTAELGLYMVAQFAGTSYNRFNDPGNTLKNPCRPKDFLQALIPTKGDSQYDVADQTNIAGNVLGSWLGAVTWNDKDWKFKLYYEHVFEDHSQMFWEYGLWTEQLVGVELELKKGKWVKNLVLEYFNLKNQSGPVYHDKTSEIPDQISAVDNNYWHHTYNFWGNYGRMLGTPLITSPIYNTDGTLGVYNNRVEAFHFGVEGEPMDWLGYRLLLTRSNNWGTYSRPFKDIKVETSGLVELVFKPAVMRNWSITTSFAFDKGDLYGNNYSGMITLTRKNVFDLSNLLK